MGIEINTGYSCYLSAACRRRGRFFLLLDLGPGAAAGGMGIDTLGTVAIYQRFVVVRAMKKLWEDLTFFYGNELIVGD